ncbi:retrovirus-related Pol polyprotein from transposon 17.6 [Trichonephila clavipes]|nr:retrovirus-related Pol polyprotein from transposon 17.6 [Trichonephila clavipes]
MADSSPKRLQPYRVPIALQKEVERQVNELLDMDLIEHSDSDWAQPVVCVAKRDGKLTKAYWQIPLEENSEHFTAFITHSGHYQWKVLPFGMKNAGRTFQKSMDQVLSPHHNYCRSYIDDVAVFSETWSGHMQHLEGIFKTLREVGLTVNLEKCDFGKSQVKFLGRVVVSRKRFEFSKSGNYLKVTETNDQKTVTRIYWFSKLLP